MPPTRRSSSAKKKAEVSNGYEEKSVYEEKMNGHAGKSNGHANANGYAHMNGNGVEASNKKQASENGLTKRSNGHVAALEMNGHSNGYSNGNRVTHHDDESPVARSHSPSTTAPSSKETLVSRADKDSGDARVVREFGGPLGVSCIALFFPVLMLYLWSCLEFHHGQLYGPTSFTKLDAWKEFASLFVSHMHEKAMPTVYAVKIYIGYVLWSALMAFIMPGPQVKGMPVPSLNYKQLVYNCNGYSSFYFTLAVSLVTNHLRWFPLRDIVDNFGSLLMTAILTGWLTSILVYVLTLALGTSHRLSGNHIYDFFMGAPLNPRVGSLDLKMWSEIRVPWIILFYVSLSAVVKVWENAGGDVAALSAVPAGLWFTLLGHWLYVNACMKGEDCIPATWDIFYEKWGFMLIFWNMAGVPFTYCYNTLYLLRRVEEGQTLVLPWYVNATLVCVLLSAYYVWDVAQAQKSHFRQSQAKTLLHRWTFPQFPAGYLKDPTFIKTQHGSPLLTAGFWGKARKIHYTADFIMSMCWALICGFGSPIPYFYPTFFFFVLVHRVTRDMERCARKYGKDWEDYCRQVPYIFIPGVF